jgi:hypothetical protein
MKLAFFGAEGKVGRALVPVLELSLIHITEPTIPEPIS